VTPGSSDPGPLHRRIRFLIRQFVLIFVVRVRRALGVAAQVLQQDELGELRKETRALGSASVESVSHVGAELREINDRLTSLEGDVEAMRRLLEERTSESGSGQAQAQGERGEASAHR
jgi:HAMP domain-containing protein